MSDRRIVRWGICSAGKICHDFAGSLHSLPSEQHQIKAVASSSLERSKSFADDFQIPKAYGSYEELACDPNIDVVYIGSVNTMHFTHTRMMLNAGKAVLCEKPFCLSSKETRSLFSLAKEKNLFLMEAIWSRCFPAYAAVQKAIEDGEIGEVRMVQGTFGFNKPYDPSQRVHSRDIGGGALFDIGVYLIQLSQFFFKEKPAETKASGFLNVQGVDDMVGFTLKYSGNRIASLACSTISTFPNDVSICGTKGFIQIHSPFWCPTTITVNGKVREFTLPEVSTPMNFANGQGLTYEAQEVRRCLMNNWIQSPLVTSAMSIELAEITEKLRKEVGYKLPQDNE